jgi:CheY-like chemotaxis protein
MSRKVLVIEDHKECREILALQMRSVGCEIIEAENGKVGIEKAAAELPDLVVMDLRMPGVDGIEATRVIKSNPQTRHIPVVVYTAWGAEKGRKDVLAAGAAMVLTKPDSFNILRELIQQFQ